MQEGEFQERQEGEEISEKEQSSEFIIPKYSARKEICNICQGALYKYTCPKCKIKTCGISCLNKHKKSNECSGVADPFTSIHCKQIQEKDVQKDYFYVKEMLSNADKVKKTLSGVDSFTQEPKRFKIMRMNAKKNYNITLLNAPTIIERHRENISFFFVKTKTFYWVVQVLYLRFQKEKEICSRFLTTPIADSTKIIDILPIDYLCKNLLEEGINTQKKEEFKVYFERKTKNSKETILLDHNSLLKDCLINQYLYEFPTIIAIHKKLQQKYLNARKKLTEKIQEKSR